MYYSIKVNVYKNGIVKEVLKNPKFESNIEVIENPLSFKDTNKEVLNLASEILEFFKKDYKDDYDYMGIKELIHPYQLIYSKFRSEENIPEGEILDLYNTSLEQVRKLRNKMIK